jgi:hypothetical protein
VFATFFFYLFLPINANPLGLSLSGDNQAGQVAVCGLQAGASVWQLGGAEMQKSFSLRGCVSARIVS